MSRSLFFLLAAVVTLGGVAAVVAATRFLSRLFLAGIPLLAAFFLLLYGAVLVLQPSGWVVINVAVLTGAVGGVLLLERGLPTPGSVAVFLAVAAVVDLVSMSGGLSRALIEQYRTGANDLLLYLTLVAPVRGRMIPIVGIGDLLVGGAAAAALIRLGYRPAMVMATLALGLLCALVYGFLRGGAPALPFIAVAVFLLLHWHSKRVAKQRLPEAET